MAGMAVKIDDSFREQFHALVLEYGLLNDKSEMTHAEAYARLHSELEYGEESARKHGWKPIDEVWKNLKV